MPKHGSQARPAGNPYETRLSPGKEAEFGKWHKKFAVGDTGADYDLRGAFQAGLHPDPKTGHWPDTFKKPNHPTFSVESKYSTPENPGGTWGGPNRDIYTPPRHAKRR